MLAEFRVKRQVSCIFHRDIGNKRKLWDVFAQQRRLSVHDRIRRQKQIQYNLRFLESNSFSGRCM